MAGTAVISTIKHDVSGAAPTFRDGAGNEIGQLCKNWSSIDGSTPAVRASFNVSSVSRSSTGCFSITMTNALVDTNYSALLSKQNAAGTNVQDIGMFNYIPVSSVATLAPTTTVYGVMINSSAQNCAYVLTAVFR